MSLLFAATVGHRTAPPVKTVSAFPRPFVS